MLFGIGLTPGVVATIIFALPPIIRFTNLGIRQVGKSFKEAGSSLGLTELLILIKIYFLTIYRQPVMKIFVNCKKRDKQLYIVLNNH